MKFRILEVKEPFTVLIFKPQYKNDGWFSTWNNIGNTKFADSIFNKVLCVNHEYTYRKYDAEKSIEEFKTYLEAKSSYIIVHEVNN